MGTTIDQLGADIRAALKSAPGRAGREAAAKVLAGVLTDEAFKAEHLASLPPRGSARVPLYEDAELGFFICAHIFEGAAAGRPHDHGPGWTIYGQAKGETEMTEWRVVEQGEGDRPTLVVPHETYVMKVGDTRVYDVGAVHSSRRKGPTWLLRVESQDMGHIGRSRIRAA